MIKMHWETGYQLDEPYGFPGDHQQNAECFNVMSISSIYKVFSVPVSLLYFVENKVYYYFYYY